MSNHLNLENILGMEPSAVAELDISEIDHAMGLIEREAKKWSDAMANMRGGLFIKFKKKLEVGTTGTQRFEDQDFDVVFNVPKNVSWDQDALAAAVVKLRDDWGEKPEEYVDTKLSISEAAWKAWPNAIKKLFADARTVKPGRMTVKIEHKPERVGAAAAE